MFGPVKFKSLKVQKHGAMFWAILFYIPSNKFDPHPEMNEFYDPVADPNKSYKKVEGIFHRTSYSRGFMVIFVL